MPPPTAKRKLFASAFAVLTVGSMALFFNLYEPWLPAGEELIPDGSFNTAAATNGWSGWNKRTKLVSDGGYKGSPGVVLTASSNEHGILRFTIYNLTNIPAFRVSLRAAASEVTRGERVYHVPRAIFFYNDTAAKSLYSLHHGVMDIPRDTGWRYYKDFFPVPAGAANARLHIQNLSLSGILRVDDVSVIPVRGRTSAPWLKLFFGTLWISAFSVCLFTLQPWKRRYGLLTTLTALVILTGIVMPGRILDSQIEKGIAVSKAVIHKTIPLEPVAVKPLAKPAVPAAVRQAKAVKPKEEAPLITLAGTAIDQAHRTGHFILFSLLAFLSSLSWISPSGLIKKAAAVFSGLLLFAAGTETLQFITADRAAALSDVYVDAAGMAGALAVVLFLRFIQRAIKHD